jgi:hypothetical protein
MAGIVAVACDRCGYRRRLTQRARQYRFPDRRTDFIEQTLAWCRACRRAVEAERLPPVSEFDEQIAEVSSGIDWLATTGRTAEEERLRLQGHRKWRLARQSPPKCLECGSASIEPFPQHEDGAWAAIDHPGCGGRLGVGYAGRALVREWPLPQYSPEGDFLTELLTDSEWVTWADPTEMLKHLEVSGKASQRKLRLFACACCRRIWDALPSEASRRAVEVSARYLDRQVKSGVRQRAEEEARSVGSQAFGRREPWKMYAAYAAWHAAMKDAWAAAFSTAAHAACAAMWYAEPASERGVGERQERAKGKASRAQCDLLRDVFNLFRPTVVEAEWKTPSVLALARGIYDDRRFEDLPILADALEEAGCVDPEVLNHCRGPGVHVKGCWLLDLVLRRGGADDRG